MNQKTILIVTVTLVVVILASTAGCFGLGNFSQVTHMDISPIRDTTRNGIIFHPNLLDKDGWVLKWSNVPVSFDIEIYTIKYTYTGPTGNNRITNKDRLVYKRTGILLNALNSESVENIGIFVSYADMDLSQGRGDENYGLADITARLPDGRIMTSRNVRTDFPS